MELVTGRKGVAHITSQQDRMKHQGTWGSGAYILQTGQMLEPQVQSSNEIRIRDGALMVQGALGCVKVNTYDPVTIQNGTQGMKRIDLICWQYTYDAEQDVESAEWVVIQGTPAESDPQQPAYTDGDIQQGDSPVQVPVFAVELDGINVTGVTTLLQTAPTLEELNSNKSNVLMTKSKGVGMTLAAGANVNSSADISEEGYTPIGVLGIAPNVYGVVPESWSVDQDTQVLHYRARNNNSRQISLTIWYDILYIKVTS